MGEVAREIHTADGGPADLPADAPACSIQASLDILGDRWTILILRYAFRGVRRFADFQRDLQIARPVLTDRLKRLVDAGVFQKQLYCERPPRHEYRLTAMGMALSPALVALMRWGDEWLSGGQAPTVLVHEPCGHPLDQQFVCWECDETFTPHEIASRPGAGTPAGIDTDTETET
ncbi:MAG: helix-turn-helix domain-containing protein [Actinomycetota bacterium]